MITPYVLSRYQVVKHESYVQTGRGFLRKNIFGAIVPEHKYIRISKLTSESWIFAGRLRIYSE